MLAKAFQKPHLTSGRDRSPDMRNPGLEKRKLYLQGGTHRGGYSLAFLGVKDSNVWGEQKETGTLEDNRSIASLEEGVLQTVAMTMN